MTESADAEAGAGSSGGVRGTGSAAEPGGGADELDARERVDASGTAEAAEVSAASDTPAVPEDNVGSAAREKDAHDAEQAAGEAAADAPADGSAGEDSAAGDPGEAASEAAGNAGEGAAEADTDGGARRSRGRRARRGRGGRPRSWLKWVAGGVGVVVLATAGTGWWFYEKLDGNITTDTDTAAQLQTYEKDRPTPVALDALNILLIGSDSRSGKGNGKYGRDDGGVSRSDTTILLHLAADRKSATAVSIPRDLMVHIPACGKTGGSTSEAQFAQFNWAYEFGGTACTTRTVEQLTGVRVDHEMVIDFSGFKDMVDAVGGVDVCLAKPVDDQEAHLRLPAGTQTLDGEQALGFVRARHGIGDGSDTERIGRQQGFLGALFTKLQSNGVLLNPTRLYPVLDAATKSITTDPGLNSLRDLYNLAHSLQNVPTDKVQFLTVPQRPYAPDPNRDELVQPDADTLFEQLRDDAPVTVEPSGSPSDPAGKASGKTGGTADAAPREEPSSSGRISETPGATPTTPSPTFTGTNASVGLCA